MSETPFARMLGTAPLSKGKKYALNLRCLLFVVAIALATLALTQNVHAQAQPDLIFTDGPIGTVTFSQPGADNYVNGWSDLDVAAITRVVNYFNDIIDVSHYGNDPITLSLVESAEDGTATGGTGRVYTMMRAEGSGGLDFASADDTHSTQVSAHFFENVTTHEFGHIFNLTFFNTGGATVDETAKTVTFTENPDPRLLGPGGVAITPGTYDYGPGQYFTFNGENSSDVFGDVWAGGTPTGVQHNPDVGGFGHPYDPPGAVMTYRGYTYDFFTETELALMQDLGNTIQRDRFFGRSLYHIYNNEIDLDTANNMNFIAADGTAGWFGDGIFSIGLHVARTDDQANNTAEGNTINVNTHLVTTGHLGTGIRIEGFNNTVNVSQDKIIAATGTEGIGIVISGINGGTSGTILNINGAAIDAQQRDIASTLNPIILIDPDHNTSYAEINFTGRVKMAGRFDLGPDYVLTIAAGDGLSGAAMTQHAEGIYGEGILEIAAGTLIMENDSILEFSHAAGNHADLIRIEAGVTAEIGDIVLNLLNPENPIIGTYTILTWVDDTTFSHGTGALSVEGLGKPGRKEGMWLAIGAWDDLNNALEVEIMRGTGNPNITDNYQLTWTGQFLDFNDTDEDGDVEEYIANNVWGERNYANPLSNPNTDENWRDQFGTEVWFMNGDSVAFDLSGDHVISLGENGDETRIVSDMTVIGDGNWTFNGTIVGDNSSAHFDDGDSNPETDEQPYTYGSLIIGDEYGYVYSLDEAFTGTLTLNGDDNDFSQGGVYVGSGTLQIGNGGATGSIRGDIYLSSTDYYDNVNYTSETLYSQLVFNSSGNHNYGETIYGEGSVTKRGTGTLTMSGSAIHTGTTTVEAGVLGVNYLVGTSALDVHAGATFVGIDPLASQTIVKGNIKNSGTIWDLALLQGAQIANEANASIINVGTINVFTSNGEYTYDEATSTYSYDNINGAYVVDVTPNYEIIYDPVTDEPIDVINHGDWDRRYNPQTGEYDLVSNPGNGYYDLTAVAATTTYGNFTNAEGAETRYVANLNAKNATNNGYMELIGNMTIADRNADGDPIVTGTQGRFINKGNIFRLYGTLEANQLTNEGTFDEEGYALTGVIQGDLGTENELVAGITVHGALKNKDGIISTIRELNAKSYDSDGGSLIGVETIMIEDALNNMNSAISNSSAIATDIDSLAARRVYNEGIMNRINTMSVGYDLTNVANAAIMNVGAMSIAHDFISRGLTGSVGTLSVGNNLNNTGVLAGINAIQAKNFKNDFTGIVAGVGSITMTPDALTGAQGTFVNTGTIALGEFDYEALVNDGNLVCLDSGTLTIDGNFESTLGTFVVGINGTDVSQIHVENGDAVINGGSVLVSFVNEMDYQLDHDYAFISVDPGTDLIPNQLMITTPLSVVNVDDPLLNAVVRYDNGSVWVALQRAFVYSGEGKTTNQRAMAQYIDVAAMYPAGDFRTALMALQNARSGEAEKAQLDNNYVITEDPLHRALDQLSGSIYGTETETSFQNTVMMHTTLANVLRRDYNHVRTAVDQYNAYYTGRQAMLPSDNMWGMVYGHAGGTTFDGNVNGYNQGFSGIMAGFDRKNDQRSRLGFFLSVGDGSLSSDLNDRALSKELMLGHYFRKDTASTYLLLQAAFGTHRYDTRRQLTFGNAEHFISRTARNQHNAFLLTGHLEAGLKYRGGIFNLSPYAGLEFTGLLREGFTEEGAGSLNITTDRESFQVFRPMFGLRFDSAPIRLRSGFASFYGNVAWMYEFEANKRPSKFTAQLSEGGVLSGPMFSVYGNEPGRDWLQAGFGLNFDINTNLRGFAGYDAYANSQQVLHSANIGFVLQR